MAKRKVNKLHSMVIGEVSLVDDPANEGARVEIVKARAFMPCDDCEDVDKCSGVRKCALGVKKGSGAVSFTEALRRTEANRNQWEAFDALRESINSILQDKDINDKEAAIGRSIDEFRAAMTESLPQLVAKALTGGFPVDPDAAAALAAFETEITMNLETLQKSLGEAEKKLGEFEAAIAKKDEEITKLKADLEAANQTITKMKDPKGAEEDVMKSLPEPVRKRVEDAERAAAAAEAAVAKMQSDKEESEAISKAAGFGIGDAKAIGPILVRVAKGKTTAEDATALEALLKQAGQIAKSSDLFKNRGTGGSGGDTDDPEALLNKKAEEIAKRDNVTFAKAYDKAMQENPDLYADYKKQRQAAKDAA